MISNKSIHTAGMTNIEILLDTRPDKIPEDRKFLLESDHDKLCRSSIYTETQWMGAMEGTVVVGQRRAATRA
jgi:hypothetical protein